MKTLKEVWLLTEFPCRFELLGIYEKAQGVTDKPLGFLSDVLFAMMRYRGKKQETAAKEAFISRLVCEGIITRDQTASVLMGLEELYRYPKEHMDRNQSRLRGLPLVSCVLTEPNRIDMIFGETQ